MVLLREGLCPGLSEDLIKVLHEGDVRTGSASDIILLTFNKTLLFLTIFVFQLRTLYCLTQNNWP